MPVFRVTGAHFELNVLTLAAEDEELEYDGTVDEDLELHNVVELPCWVLPQ